MKCPSPSKLDQQTHEFFVSSLRTWCNTEDNVVQTSTDLNLAWINHISSKLLVGAKVDLMKIFFLDRLSKVEIHFLKLAVPNLIYFAKTQNYVKCYESYLNKLRAWSGVPEPVDGGDRPPNAVLINKLKFKNILLKLLSNSSSDKRVRRMQQFILDPTELESSDGSSPDATPSHHVNSPKSPHSPNFSHTPRCFNSTSIYGTPKALSAHKCCFTPKSRQTPRCSYTPKAHGSRRCDESLISPSTNAVSPQKDCTLNPSADALLSLIDKRRVPNLHIDYVEPTVGLFSTKHLNLNDARDHSRYHVHNCFSKRSRGKWVESLRGGYIPSHIHFN